MKQPKIEFWNQQFQGLLNEFRAQQSIVIGDFNTGSRNDREGSTRFYGEKLFEENLASDWTSALHAMNQDKQEFSWWSSAGNGFLIDHAWLSPSTRDRLTSANISHIEREAKVSDHSALIVDLSS